MIFRRNMKKLYIIFILLISACTQPVEFYPDKLPNAKLNELYVADIDISGGRIIPSPYNVQIEPKDSGFQIFSKVEGEFNNLSVTGTAKSKQTIKITLNVATYGTGLSTGLEGKKIYLIQVD